LTAIIRLQKATLADRSGSDADAPISAIRGTTVEPPSLRSGAFISLMDNRE
jgi:hypothetical protein